MFDTVSKEAGMTTWGIRDREILEYFSTFGYRSGPSAREVARRLGVAVSTAHRDLRRLAVLGALEDLGGAPEQRRARRVARGYRLSGRGAALIGFGSYAGKLAAGDPIDADADPDADGEAAHTIFDVLGVRLGDRLYMARGSSMIDSGIRDGDYLLVRPRPVERLRDSEIVFALVTASGIAEMTLKHVSRDRGRIMLRPANLTGVNWQGQRHRARRYDPEEVDVKGVLVWVISNGNPRAVRYLPARPEASMPVAGRS
jgi:SOS-response transcriptional repressor LexA